ncbi:hypothetical protein D3C86_2106950 [compost metagenome]
MYINESGHNGFSANINNPGICRKGKVFTYGNNFIVLDQDIPVFNHFIALHGNDTGAFKGC